MITSQEKIELYSRLQKALGQLLEEQNPEIKVFQEGDYPLLVLEISNDSAGFAVVNGTPENEFKTAYDSFKKIYRKRHESWKERNLSFVICRLGTDIKHDAFFSSLEMDVYFCKKYIVRFHHDQEALEQELLRLPFLPLPEGRPGVFVRPLAAQTLLQNLNISASIARQIIVPREYSATRIVADAIAKKDPIPPISDTRVTDKEYQIEPSERTRIKNIAIEAFRVYRKRREFNLDADVIVLYGPNGLGKTSFFDALDYVCTGRIGRLCRRRISPNKFKDLARHLSTLPGDGYVEMEAIHDGKSYQISRRVNDWGNALIDGEGHDRADILQFLTSAQWGIKKARIENLERLFRATHLFSQADPEFLLDFEYNSILSEDLVSRALALDDYASGISKVDEVLSLLKKKYTKNDSQLSLVNEKIKETKTKIAALPEPKDSDDVGKQISKLAKDLVRDLKKNADLVVDDTELNLSSVREWRALTESNLKDSRLKLSRIQLLESEFDQFEKNKLELNLKKAQLAKLKVELEKRKVDQKQKEQKKQKFIEDLRRYEEDQKQAKAKLRALDEIDKLEEVALRVSSSLDEWQQELKRSTSEFTSTSTELQSLYKVGNSLDNKITELQEAIEVASQRSVGIKLKESITSLESKNEKIQTSISKHQKIINAKTEELDKAVREYEIHTKNQADLTRLLDEIEAHVIDSVCPTCGVNHKSKKDLIDRIQKQKEARPAHVDYLAKSCRKIRRELNEKKELIDSLVKKQSFLKKDLEKLSLDLDQKRQTITKYECSVENIGLSMNENIRKEINTIISKESTKLQELTESLKKLQAELSKIKAKIKKLERKQSQVNDAINRANKSIEPLEKQMNSLRTKADALGFSLDFPTNQIVSEKSVWSSREKIAKKITEELATKNQRIQKSILNAKASFREVKTQFDTVQKEIEEIEKAIREYKDKATGIFGSRALKINHIHKQKKQAEDRVSKLEKLTQQAYTLERTFDFSQRSIIFAELHSKNQELVIEKQKITEERKRIAVVRDWFAQVRDILDSENSEAVSNHVRAFGPLTTIIQKRLRAVYGFGDVSLKARGSEIRVVVEWEGKNVKPTDYFSDSQKQILMLSLFLAGRLTQSWSGFAPILMDDPVTHFDDLNAFGFVELIRGLVSSSPGQRQFFISTCEQRLFELMRKKFRGFDGGAKFYRFEGISSDGPTITALND